MLARNASRICWNPKNNLNSVQPLVGIIFHMKGLGKQVAPGGAHKLRTPKRASVITVRDGEKYKCHNHIKHAGLKKHVSWHNSFVATWNTFSHELPYSNSMLGHPAVLTFASDSSICVGLWLSRCGEDHMEMKGTPAQCRVDQILLLFVPICAPHICGQVTKYVKQLWSN